MFSQQSQDKWLSWKHIAHTHISIKYKIQEITWGIHTSGVNTPQGCHFEIKVCVIPYPFANENGAFSHHVSIAIMQILLVSGKVWWSRKLRRL